MSKFLCPCGEVIRISGSIPNPVEWLLESDRAFDHDHTIDPQELYFRMVHLFRCPTSDHLFIFWRGFDAPGTTYSPTGKID
jgi:hypothetical protein